MTDIVITRTPTAIKDAMDGGGTVSSASFKLVGDGGTSVAQTIVLGWNPNKVEVWDITTQAYYVWVSSMPAASVFKMDDAGAQTYVTSNGVTVSNGSLTLGTDIITTSATHHVLCTL
jgi:hypothetical protein